MTVPFMRIIHSVVPHAGTWIEISCKRMKNMLMWVVPHAGTWIEIMQCKQA